MITDVGIALLTTDQRLYRVFTQFPYLVSSTSGNVEFNYSFPSGVPLGTIGMSVMDLFLIATITEPTHILMGQA